MVPRLPSSVLPVVLPALLLAATPVSADELNTEELDRLIEELDLVGQEVDRQRNVRSNTALEAFQEALRTPVGLINLYRDCVERVDFDDQNRSAEDYRNWREEFEENTDTGAFALALRFQLRWLVLMMEADTMEDPRVLAPRALEIVRDIFAAENELDREIDKLEDSVLGTPFARAFNLDHLRTEGVPNAPLPVGSVYDQMVLPRLREAGDIQALRAAWEERVALETRYRRATIRPDGRDNIEDTPAWREFVEEERPQLLWNMESDLYQAGDQRAAAVRMLELLRERVAHPAAESWEDQFRSLVGAGLQAVEPGADQADQAE